MKKLIKNLFSKTHQKDFIIFSISHKSWQLIDGKIRHYDGFHLDGKRLTPMENYNLQNKIIEKALCK